MLGQLCFLLFAGGAVPAFASFDQTHTKWDQILKSAVVLSRDGKSSGVKYATIDGAHLDSYLTDLSAVGTADFATWSDAEKQAFLINAYNAFTVKWILLNKIPASIKDTGSFFKSPWKQPFFKLFGTDTSLSQIENNLARAKFKNCRLGFAFTAAAKGSPMLRAEAWTASHLTAQFEDSTRRFLTDSTRNSYEAAHNSLELSQIFNSHAVNFAADPSCGGSVSTFVRRYMTYKGGVVPESALVKFQEFDWSLNQAP